MKSAGHIGWYEHEAWDEGDLLGLGKEQHLYNTYLPIPSFLLSKHSLPGNQPTQAAAGSLPDTDVLHRTCVLQTSSGAGSRKQDLLPPSITAPLPAVPERTAKRGMFSEILSSLGSRRLCRVGPESSRAHSWLEVITPEHLTRPVHTAPQAPPPSLHLERGEERGHRGSHSPLLIPPAGEYGWESTTEREE